MSHLFRYLAYGLQIDSDIELPELGGHHDRSGEADLTIRRGEVARFGTEGGGRRGRVRWIDPQHFWLHVNRVAHYLVSEGRNIVVMAEPEAEPSEVRAYLLGSVCGAMLLQRGFLVLHGNAIRLGDGCLVCVGDSGAGKSTLAAGFLKRGFQVLADDVVAVDAAGCAIPGFPRIKLWQDAADILGLSTAGRARVFPGMDKFNIPIESFDPGALLPIRWVYQLTSDEVEDIRIEPITGLRRFRLLRDNTYRNEYLDGIEMLSGHLSQCSRLAGQIHLAKVVRPSTGFSLDRLIDRLIEDTASNGPESGEG
jgi:hypothetical protein